MMASFMELLSHVFVFSTRSEIQRPITTGYFDPSRSAIWGLFHLLHCMHNCYLSG